MAVSFQWNTHEKPVQSGPTPLEQAEQLLDKLIQHYNEGQDKELRAASKMLLVALDQFRKHGGQHWQTLFYEYVNLALFEPDTFNKILDNNRSHPKI
jgi:hypothetical protein